MIKITRYSVLIPPQSQSSDGLEVKKKRLNLPIYQHVFEKKQY